MHSVLITQPLALLLFENCYYYTVLAWQDWYYTRTDTIRGTGTFRVYTVSDFLIIVTTADRNLIYKNMENTSSLT